MLVLRGVSGTDEWILVTSGDTGAAATTKMRDTRHHHLHITITTHWHVVKKYFKITRNCVTWVSMFIKNLHHQPKIYVKYWMLEDDYLESTLYFATMTDCSLVYRTLVQLFDEYQDEQRVVDWGVSWTLEITLTGSVSEREPRVMTYLTSLSEPDTHTHTTNHQKYFSIGSRNIFEKSWRCNWSSGGV